VAVLFKQELDMKVIHSSEDDIFTHFECVECSVMADKRQVRLCAIYCPSPSRQNGYTKAEFFNESPSNLHQQTTMPQHVIITRDLNFLFGDHADINASIFKGCLKLMVLESTRLERLISIAIP